ncbi:MAG: hypothetical protein IPJ09_21710 [Saprospiraceae bacterium]|nr:hypothetical protein [Saprospiraceae bacterium]
MKTRHLFCLLLLSTGMIYTSCTRDQVISADQPISEAEAIQWKPADGIARFIPQEYKDNILAEDLAFAERLLLNPKEEDLAARGQEIHIAAGSSNSLASAIASAGHGDVIVLDPGDHFETGTVYIDKTISLMGYGANYISSGVVFGPNFNSTSAIHVTKNGCISTIRGITFKSTEAHPGTCIFLENTKSVKVLYNKMENWNISIMMATSDFCSIIGNKVFADASWTTGDIQESDGIVISDGKHNQVVSNEVAGAVLGIFTGGSQGMDFSNYTHDCFMGQILCRVPAGGYTMGGYTIDGYDSDTKTSTARWLAVFNKSENNYFCGYSVVDGSHDNLLQHNTTANNAAYDFFLLGDSNFFGFPTPRAFNNTIEASSSQTIKDCAENSKIRGGMLIDTSLDPCE